ncbi:MAG: PHB depolymerase family esterase, partial [Acidimicrobiia bacterium]
MLITKPLSSVLLVGLIMSGAGLSADAVALASQGGDEVYDRAPADADPVDEGKDEEQAPPTEPYFGQDRTTGKFIPTRVDESPRQLVVLLHGYGQSILGILGQMPLLQAAFENDWILLAPSGLEDSRSWPYWNATPTCCDRNRRGNDDVAYLRSVIRRHLERYRIKRDRVAIVGLSNGGFMAYQLACHASDLVGTIVVISGVERMDLADCNPRRPVNVYHIHGRFDRAVFFQGGLIGIAPQAFAPFPSAPETVRRWAVRNSCPTTDATVVSVARGQA